MIKYDKRKFKAYQIPGVDEADFKDDAGNIILVTGVRKQSGSFYKKCKICSRESINLKECNCCKWYFCDVHIKPKHIEDMSNKNFGHLCSPYTEQNPYVEQQDKEKMQKQSIWKRLKK